MEHGFSVFHKPESNKTFDPIMKHAFILLLLY